jgi:serine/threonine-protein kinase HipA
MMARAAIVRLYDLDVGLLREDEHGFIEFRVDPAFVELPARPVLGQWFEDHPRGVQRGARPQELPPFFANLIPEGDLGVLLRERLHVEYGDDLGLLLAVGGDLPGAVTVVPASDERCAGVYVLDPEVEDEPTNQRLRFSLAGVQLKFSMVRTADRFAFPGRDTRGDWIAKLALAPYDEVGLNEFVTMTWARHSGFEVPDCELHSVADLSDVPYDPYSIPTTADVFVIRRYDRDASRRIHQEDFQQVVGRRPAKKYDDVTYEQLTMLAMKVVGDGVYEEMLRRIVFVVASGNDDAHLKNWSVLYPDRIHPKLTPLYDQVFTAQWPQLSHELALNLGGTKLFTAIDLGRFRELARRTGEEVDRTERVVEQTLQQISTAWPHVVSVAAPVDSYRARLVDHWRRVPLLAPFADRIATV